MSKTPPPFGCPHGYMLGLYCPKCQPGNLAYNLTLSDDPKTITRETHDMEKRIDAVMAEVRAELIRATEKHGPMKSVHEAFGIIYEEFNVEFAAEMVANNKERQRVELIQVAAMGCRAILDVC